MRRAEIAFGRTSLSYPKRDVIERLFLLDTKEKSLDIREKLDGCVLVGDGVLGTLLADRRLDQPYNIANLTDASAVQAVHEEHLHAAGARVIEAGAYLMPLASRPHLARDVIEPIV